MEKPAERIELNDQLPAIGSVPLVVALVAGALYAVAASGAAGSALAASGRKARCG